MRLLILIFNVVLIGLLLDFQAQQGGEDSSTALLLIVLNLLSAVVMLSKMASQPKMQCPQCGHIFAVTRDDTTTTCPDCGLSGPIGSK